MSDLRDRDCAAMFCIVDSVPVTKRCRTCHEHKRPEEFPRHNGAHDGRRSACRRCLLTERYRPYIENPEQRARRANRERGARWQRKHLEALERYVARYPHRDRCRRQTYQALRSGKLQRADRCQVEGCTSAKCVEAHHHDYSKPLEILWCCAAHHRQGHAQGFIRPAPGIDPIFGDIPEEG